MRREAARTSSSIALRIGAELEPLELTVSAEKMKTAAALLADPNPIHFDTAAVQALGLGDRPVNQGPLNMGYIMNLLAVFSGSHDRLRRLKVRFLANVFAGDRIRATGTIADIQTLPDRHELLVKCTVELAVLNGSKVLAGTATVAVPESMYSLHETTAHRGRYVQ